MKAKLKLLPSKSPCGCGSGLAYRNCCKNKKFKYYTNGRGSVVKSIPIHKELDRELEETQLRFKSMYGRSIRREPFLFDIVLNGEQDQWQAIKRITDSANIREELVFAWRRSGFIVGENSIELMAERDLAEWDGAIDEYREISKLGYDPFYLFTYLDAVEFDLYKQCEALIEHAVVIGFNSIKKARKFKNPQQFYQLLMALSALNSSRTIYHMFRERYDDDALAITRGIYDNICG